MFVTPLNTRRKETLQAVVEAYIETASPISSQAIVQRLRSRISSATVRHVMAELEELGLIWQPHTSAGRIPTDLGYRYYIDTLMEVEQLTVHEQKLLEEKYPRSNKVFDELLLEFLRLLSNFSGYTALAFSSGLRKIIFKRLEFVSVQSMKLLVVLVSQEGLVKTGVVKLPYKIEQEELAKIARMLNEEFTGLTLDEIKERLTTKLSVTKDALFHLLKSAGEILESAYETFEQDRLYLEGTSYILEQPEFQSPEKLQLILKTFEQPEPLLKIMKEDLDSEGVRVHIGRENPEDIRECSLVVSNFKVGNINFGTLGIIGPRRMAYAKAISTVGFMAQFFSGRITTS